MEIDDLLRIEEVFLEIKVDGDYSSVDNGGQEEDLHGGAFASQAEALKSTTSKNHHHMDLPLPL